jgi:hypothetical protein
MTPTGGKGKMEKTSNGTRETRKRRKQRKNVGKF